MLKVLVDKWYKNKDKLEQFIIKSDWHTGVTYNTIVKTTFEYIYNSAVPVKDYDEYGHYSKIDVDNITEINNGEYQGTLIYVIPFKCMFQPTESDYLITFADYGSCSGCDTIERILNDWNDEITDTQVEDFMMLCKDIITRTTKPYGSGWLDVKCGFVHCEI